MTQKNEQHAQNIKALAHQRMLHEQEEDIRHGQEGMETEGPIPQRKHSHLDPMGKLSLSGGYKPLPQHGRKDRG
jgi:hypothetical protein